MTTLDQALSQLDVIVDFAIKDDGDLAGFIKNRLFAARQIDDAEPTHAKCHCLLGVRTSIIGTTIADAIEHGID